MESICCPCVISEDKKPVGAPTAVPASVPFVIFFPKQSLDGAEKGKRTAPKQANSKHLARSGSKNMVFMDDEYIRKHYDLPEPALYLDPMRRPLITFPMTQEKSKNFNLDRKNKINQQILDGIMDPRAAIKANSSDPDFQAPGGAKATDRDEDAGLVCFVQLADLESQSPEHKETTTTPRCTCNASKHPKSNNDEKESPNWLLRGPAKKPKPWLLSRLTDFDLRSQCYTASVPATDNQHNITEVYLIMDPACTEPNSNMFEGGSRSLLVSNAESKTDSEANVLETIKEENKSEEINERIDDIEREDFDEENRIINHCSGLIVDASKITATSHFSGNLSSANSSLASSSETISTLSHSATDYNLPGCSKMQEGDDSNTTIRNMIHSRKLTYTASAEAIEPKKPEPVVFKNDFMQKLLASGPAEEKTYPKGKMYKGDDKMAELSEQCEISGPSGRTSSNASSIASTSSESIKESFSVPSTSNAEKLLGLGNGCSNSQPSNSHRSPSYLHRYDDDDSDDSVNEEAWCTCLSSHEDDDESDIPDINDDRLWRKRRYDPPLIVTSPQSAKKFCPEGSSGSSSGESDWLPNLPGSSLAGSSLQGPPEMKQWLHKFQTWSNGEKIQAIDALISRCAAGQVRHMMKAIEPLFQRDFISLLPKELALTVLGYLQPKDLLRAAQTCQYWRFLADDNLLWKEQCRRIGITTLKKRARSLPRCASPWKAAYMRQYLIENNWLHKPVDNPIIMRGHDDHVITCLQFYGNRILSGSDDTTLKVWSAVTGKCLRTLVGHTGGVWSSQMVGDLVISGSTDRTLRVWNAKSGQCLKVLAGHTSTVRCMHLYQNRVVSGSRDATLRVWSIPDGRCMRVLVGHLAAVRCVQYDGKVVVSGAYDYFVKVWNPDTGECLHTLAGHTNRVYSLQFDGVHVVSGSLDTSIRVWDVESGQLKHTLIGHQSLTSGMELHSNILVSGNADSTVKVWDISTGHCLHTLSGPNKHQSAVTCLQSSNRFVITSSDDGTVKLWDVRTGEFIRNLVELGSGGSGGVVWRIRASATKLICAVGSRNGTEETKLLVLDFDVPGACRKCDE